jgi:hypothetical protein
MEGVPMSKDPWSVEPAQELSAAIDRLDSATQRSLLGRALQNYHNQEGAVALIKLVPEFRNTWHWPGRIR